MRPDRLTTGLLAATLLRATESLRPKSVRIIDDRFARRFLPPLWRVMLLPGLRGALPALVERRGPGARGMLLCRTRFIDDALVAALADGVEQVVNLGAGLDSRAFRVPGIEKTQVFELDRAGPLAWKKARLRQMFGTQPGYVSFVPIDFETQTLAGELAQAGFRDSRRTFFIWEGVTQYLTPEAVDATLDFVVRQSGPGSQIAFTYVHRDIIDGTARSEVDQRFVTVTEREGMSWRFGLHPDEVEGFLSERGLALVDYADAAAYRERYFSPGRRLDVYPGERIVLAETISPAS